MRVVGLPLDYNSDDDESDDLLSEIDDPSIIESSLVSFMDESIPEFIRLIGRDGTIWSDIPSESNETQPLLYAPSLTNSSQNESTISGNYCVD